MPDPTEPSRSATASQANKRRRIDDSTPESSVQGSAEEYDRWKVGAQHSQGSNAFASVSDPPTFTTRSEYNHPAIAPTESNTESGSQWVSHGSSYPELPGYQQQPYFYQQTPNPASYTSSWPHREPHQYEATGTSSSYTAEQQTSAAAMPDFPTKILAQSGSASDIVDATAAISRSGVDQANQNAYSTPSALTTAAQREAAKQSSAFYFDDAGMPLKIQSLPILDNLVRDHL